MFTKSESLCLPSVWHNVSEALHIFHCNNIWSWSHSCILSISLSYNPAQLLSLHGKGHEEGSNAGTQSGLASSLFPDMQLNKSKDSHLDFNLYYVSNWCWGLLCLEISKTVACFSHTRQCQSASQSVSQSVQTEIIKKDKMDCNEIWYR